MSQVLHHILSLVVQGFVWPMYVHLRGGKSDWGNISQSLTAGCMEPIPPSRGSIDNFQSAAEWATITYSCSSGLVPRTQMSAVCTNMTWRPDPATLECREPSEYVTFEFPELQCNSCQMPYFVLDFKVMCLSMFLLYSERREWWC